MLLNYDVLAPRILNGALADVLLREQARKSQGEEALPPPADAPRPTGAETPPT